jgi:hypothetical protein
MMDNVYLVLPKSIILPSLRECILLDMYAKLRKVLMGGGDDILDECPPHTREVLRGIPKHNV